MAIPIIRFSSNLFSFSADVTFLISFILDDLHFCLPHLKISFQDLEKLIQKQHCLPLSVYPDPKQFTVFGFDAVKHRLESRNDISLILWKLSFYDFI